MSKFLQFLRSLGLLIARLGVGGIMIMHGLTRWRGQGQGIQKQIAYLTQFGTPYPEIAAWGATIFELVGGLFLIVGVLTPIVGLGLLIEQVLIIAYTSWYKRWNLLNPDGSYNGGYEYNVALGLLGLLFFVMGGGAFAIDRLFRRKRTELDEDSATTPASANA
jgi:putative oxidoreductase